MVTYGFGGSGPHFVINPPSLTTVSINPTSVTGGQSATGTIMLNGAAPTGGIVVALTSSSADAKVPAKVTIPAGQTSATFTITTIKVRATATVQLKATASKVSQTVTLTINK